MAFSLSNWFKGKPEDGSADTQVESGPAAPAPAAAPPDPSQPAADTPKARVTVRAVRTVVPHSAQHHTVRAPSARQAIALPVAPGHQSLENFGRVTPILPPSRKVSFGSSADPMAHPFSEPPRPERAPAPPPMPAGPDVPVILEVGDFVDRLPSSLLQPGTLDRQRKVEFRSSELYSDLTKGRASVPASVIYQKCADIFSRPVSATEDIEVALPLQKLVEQMSGTLQPRRDQVEVENVGEIETPFLQVALEDNVRLPKASGTSAGPIASPHPAAARSPAPAPAPSEPPLREHHRTGQISTITPPKAGSDAGSPLAPPTAQTAGSPTALKRPPATVRASVAGAKIRVSGPVAGNRTITPVGKPLPGVPGAAGAQGGPPSAQSIGPLPSAASPSHQVAKKTARIQIPPISLRSAGAAPKPASPLPPTAPAVPSPLSARPAPAPLNELPTFRSAPGQENSAAATFRSTPPPPSAVKPPPPSFSPRQTRLVAPAAATATPPKAGTSAPAPAAQPVPTAPLTASAATPFDERQIALKLAAILRGLPATALARDPAQISDETPISLPFRLIQPQLSSGRVTIPLDIFVGALPEEYRDLIAADAGLTDVPLPLQEIFLNLPASALSIRADQITEESGANYLTPFSQKAEEDARRFIPAETGVPSAEPDPVAQSLAAPEQAEASATGEAEIPPLAKAPEPEPVAEAEPLFAPLVEEPWKAADARSAQPEPIEALEAAEPEPAEAEAPASITAQTAVDAMPVAAPAPTADESTAEIDVLGMVEEAKPRVKPTQSLSRPPTTPLGSAPAETVLQTLFMTEDELDAKTVVKLVSQLPGINGCTVMFGDGLRLAGNFPENGHAEGFSAMSPPFYKRTMNFASELKLGELQAFTIYTNTGLLSFFMHDDICMSVRHAGRGFLPGVREKLETVTRELALMYSAAVPAAN